MSKPPRLYVDAPLSGAGPVPLAQEQAHYLLTVMRRSDGDAVLLFNGRDGEWLGEVRRRGKRDALVEVSARTREQSSPVDLHYCFAPIKKARLDFIAQKATELGASELHPVITRHTITERVKTDRLRANAVEAAEQCGVLWVPDVAEPVSLEGFLADRDPLRTLVFCDEAAPVQDPIAALKAVQPGPLAVLIGPEGGFSEEEAQALRASVNVVAISLGPRVMRADTAGIAALTLIQAVLGDWT
ncbi:16S rRNA (uracil(1498)-N(3))-methyltransferase [Microbaculum marinum]|uniref:Ribosomal RNA small subunit methyltransferase E n=1 Tax=Microbaculum marinum TaxID=1764581 RepID=A0AAW9RMK9_9HYPH